VPQLCERVPDVHLWAANVNLLNFDMPPQLEALLLTKPLRYSPTVLRELQLYFDEYHALGGLVVPSVMSGTHVTPAAGEGGDVITLDHHGEGHTGTWPLDCERCGRNVGVKLRQIGVGNEGQFVESQN
jgi:hypothetical protein